MNASNRGAARLRLQLIGAELDGERVHWTFTVGDDAGLFVHASTDDINSELQAAWHTPIDGLHVVELDTCAPEDFTIGLPAGVTRHELQERIDEELARLDLALQFFLDAIDRRAQRTAVVARRAVA